jgi:hypothetical protein
MKRKMVFSKQPNSDVRLRKDQKLHFSYSYAKYLTNLWKLLF